VLTFARVGDVYGDGEKIREHIAHPEADLAFRVLVR
jgi:hypothetical protein